ncbi:MAG: argininosuccinate synthase [Ignavibacteria bacterium GWA2_35_9]|nr:MAG: argininosuccinate synthase [Ignavibacteria bacterium GWA2_35_9]OGU46376.1 MAG: argininosuccinate synthase [Ignavibacteria bacterium GWB2_36_8]OGU48217.1 MAG: argininosuccinate synthase [Ignavibacteria bacterium GWC2_36_12]
MNRKKIAVAYSGGLDTSVMVKWLSEKYDADIITVTGILGKTKELDGLEEKAYKTGASKVVIVDLQEKFVNDYAFKALKAGALYEGVYPLATAIGRPLLVKLLVETALAEGADTVAHGCTGKGNDQVRFEVGVQSIAPELNILAPLRTWEFNSRDEEIDYALKYQIPVKVTKSSPYSIDENLWGIAIECGVLEDPTVPPPDDAYQITVDPKLAQDEPEVISIGFEHGVPKKLNGQSYSSAELVSVLNFTGGRHGIGRIDLIENRIVGIKSREIYEAPAAVILHKAHYELEKLVLDRETFRFKQVVSDKVANLIYDGLWYTPLFEGLMAFVDAIQKDVTGEVTLEFYKGNVNVLSRTSPFSSYDKYLATYTPEDTFDRTAAEGFLKIYGLPYKTLNLVSNKTLEEV